MSIPIVDANNKDFNNNLAFEMFACDGSTCYDNRRNRPYNGQAHTDTGVRGKLDIKGLTARDICDCFIMGYLDAIGLCGRVESGKWRYEDVYHIEEMGGIIDHDPIAIMQNMSCHIEKMMGVYPYLPPEAKIELKKFMEKLKEISEDDGKGD